MGVKSLQYDQKQVWIGLLQRLSSTSTEFMNFADSWDILFKCLALSVSIYYCPFESLALLLSVCFCVFICFSVCVCLFVWILLTYEICFWLSMSYSFFLDLSLSAVLSVGLSVCLNEFMKFALSWDSFLSVYVTLSVLICYCLFGLSVLLSVWLSVLMSLCLFLCLILNLWILHGEKVYSHW